MIKIRKTNIEFEREPLLAPFGFKGGYMTEIWQIVTLLESESGQRGVGLGVQSVLWSDARVFASTAESAGNSMMFLMTAHALHMIQEIPFDTPMDLWEQLLPITYEYGKKVTSNPDLRLTFALNALVGVDNAAWLLYCREKGITNFDDIIPHEVHPALSYRHSDLTSIPLISYSVPLEEIIRIVDSGRFFLKIKIGSDPAKDGDREKMLEWDKQRLSDIHTAMKDRETPYTADGCIPYYLDANGRYDSKERLLRFLEHADRIEALERIVLFEEPFPEGYRDDVHDIPVRLAVDESAHSDKEASDCIERGYGAIAIKPIAKTMSMSFKIAKVAYEKGIPCFCADLTVNPVLVDWNKNVASRLTPLPGMKIGLLESNGHQNYRNWDMMKSYHPCYGATWMETVGGLFRLDNDFYARSGGMFEPSEHYTSLVG